MGNIKCNLFLMVIVCLVAEVGFCYSRAHDKGHNIPHITMMGTGYVGLVTGACLADMGNRVICYDIDENKIAALQQNVIPIYEPGLQEIVRENMNNGYLAFTSDVSVALADADVIFIAVGTPMDNTGNADLRALQSAVKSIASHITSYKVICVKSTVPVGTCNWISTYLSSLGIEQSLYDVVSNPEFLREGSAVNDFMNPDRIVVGTASQFAAHKVAQLYAPLLQNGVPVVYTSLVSSETIKYASNAFLACKLSFVNEIANLCEKTGANIQDVAYGMGLDKRIGVAFLKPGPGFGGSCFPKDCHALVYAGQQYNVPLHMIETALAVNDAQQLRAVNILCELMKQNSLQGKTIAVLGLAFKNNTDDIRYSPAIITIEQLLQKGATVVAYDPAAMDNMQKLFPTITYAHSAYEAVVGADALIVMTEWDEFRKLDMQRIQALMNDYYIVDMRNMLNSMACATAFHYLAVGNKPCNI